MTPKATTLRVLEKLCNLRDYVAGLTGLINKANSDITATHLDHVTIFVRVTGMELHQSEGNLRHLVAHCGEIAGPI